MLELKLRIVSKCDGIEDIGIEFRRSGIIVINRYDNNIENRMEKEILRIYEYNKIDHVKYLDKNPIREITEKEMFEIIESWRVE